MFPRVLVLALAVLAAGPALSQAQDVAPPGNSAVDQYRESAPPPAAKSKKVSKTTRKKLEAEGADGQALAAALDRSGGVVGAREAGTPDAETEDGKGTASADGTTSDSAPAGEVGLADRGNGRQSTDSPTQAAAAATVGPFPVWAMVAAALAAVGVGFLVRHRSA